MSSSTALEKRLRSPISVVLGHIDTGKTTLLDRIRNVGREVERSVAARESGGITQHIGASFLPRETIETIAKDLLASFKIKLTIPGILCVDTPGHAAFLNLRARGSSVADIAILVVDVRSGFQAQTYESMRLLKDRKTPFLVAANKLDLVPGWRSEGFGSFLGSVDSQENAVQNELDQRLYELIGELAQEGFESERYDRVQDFTKSVAIVPISAKTGEGVPDLLVILAGLTQQFLKKRLSLAEGPAKGVILEVKEETGIGLTIDTIIYDGIMRKEDTIVTGGLSGPITTRIRSLLLPKPLDEIRDPRDKFTSVEEVTASAGVKISAPNLEGVIAGAPVFVVPEDESVENYVSRISEEVSMERFESSALGVVAKADTLGSLEALAKMLKDENIPVSVAGVGPVSRREVVEAEVVRENDPLLGAVLCFNVSILPEAQEEIEQSDMKVFLNDVIYRLVDEYKDWLREEAERSKKETFETITTPGKIKVLPGFVFRKSKPAVFGVEVLGGKIKAKKRLIRQDNKPAGVIQQIQDKGETIPEAAKGQQVAISLRGITIGRQVKEGDILFIDILEKHAGKLKKEYFSFMTDDEINVLEELIEIKRKQVNKFWAT
ncbi:MAG: translation initiation factor IF-2 [Candidatus Wukongarchaeota archaeon]|nr:translation initiation factor IF-2 [Candidatus Wukongarchaeota archaeon]